MVGKSFWFYEFRPFFNQPLFSEFTVPRETISCRCSNQSGVKVNPWRKRGVLAIVEIHDQIWKREKDGLGEMGNLRKLWAGEIAGRFLHDYRIREAWENLFRFFWDKSNI